LNTRYNIAQNQGKDEKSIGFTVKAIHRKLNDLIKSYVQKKKEKLLILKNSAIKVHKTRSTCKFFMALRHSLWMIFNSRPSWFL
jgi:hypothetical protein